MSASSVSATNFLTQAGNNSFSQRRTDFQQLASALQSGDLSAAQQAFSQLQSDIGTSSVSAGSVSSTTSSSNNRFQSLMSQIGSALQAGNLSDAQQALSDFQNHPPSAGSESGGGSGSPGAILDAVFQALSQAGISGGSAANSSSAPSTTTSASDQNPLQALGAFMHDLFSALQNQGGQAAQGAQTSAQGTSDSDRGHGGTGTSAVSGAPRGHHHHGGGGVAHMESNLQSLIQQLSSSDSTSSATDTSGSSTATASATNSSSALQQSYQNLLSSLGLSGGSSSLGNFLQALSQNLQDLGSTGNVVNTQV